MHSSTCFAWLSWAQFSQLRFIVWGSCMQVRVGLPLPRDPEVKSHVCWRHCNVGLRDVPWKSVAATLDAFTGSVTQHQEHFNSGKHTRSFSRARGRPARALQVRLPHSSYGNTRGHLTGWEHFLSCAQTNRPVSAFQHKHCRRSAEAVLDSFGSHLVCLREKAPWQQPAVREPLESRLHQLWAVNCRMAQLLELCWCLQGTLRSTMSSFGSSTSSGMGTRNAVECSDSEEEYSPSPVRKHARMSSRSSVTGRYRT
jgi:hypothetical protein